MKTAVRLRNRIEKAMVRDLRRQQQRPHDTTLNAFAFLMDVNRAILKTVSELAIEFEDVKKRQRRM
jgi:hypothetical protein